MATKRICSIEGCGKKHRAHGYCGMHWQRITANGSLKLKTAATGEPMRYLRSLVGNTTEDCIFWPFGKTFAVKFRGQSAHAYHVMCFVAHGEAPTPKHEAAHSCGNGHLGCVNPNHLRWATHKENDSDKDIHGTRVRGERVHSAKLTEKDVLAIRAAVANGEKQHVVGDRYGIQRYHVASITTRRIWRHI